MISLVGNRYREPPPEFNPYSYQDRNERNTPEPTFGQARIYNQNLRRKGVPVCNNFTNQIITEHHSWV